MCDKLAMAGKIVVVVALIGNHRREGFKKILNLLPNVETSKILTIICDMSSEEKNCFSRHRTLVEPEEKTIGGEIELITLFRKCWKLKKQNSQKMIISTSITNTLLATKKLSSSCVTCESKRFNFKLFYSETYNAK